MRLIVPAERIECRDAQNLQQSVAGEPINPKK
jgi:hypothetical protein